RIGLHLDHAVSRVVGRRGGRFVGSGNRSDAPTRRCDGARLGRDLLRHAPKWSGKSLAPDPDRAPLVTRAFDDFATGRFTKEEVLDTVTRLGLRTRKGLQLNPQSFGRMLTNRLYAGFEGQFVD